MNHVPPSDKTGKQVNLSSEEQNKDRNILDILSLALPWAVWIKDTSGNFLFSNNIYHSLVDKNPYDALRIPGALTSDLLEEYEIKVLSQKKERYVEISFGKVWFQLYISPWFTSSGELGGIIGTARDISREKNAILELREENSYFHTLMDNIPDSIYFKDNRSRFTRINKAKSTQLGLKDPAEAVGKTDFEFLSSDKAQETFNDEVRIFSTGEAQIDKIEKQIDANGNAFWISSTKIPVRNEAGSITGLIGISRDISQLILTQQKLEEALKKAEESDRLKTAFLANMSHEIRTPLNGIVGFANLLNNSALSEEKRNEYLTIINSCTSNLLTLIDDILDIAKIEAGQLRIYKSDVRLNLILKDIYRNFENIRYSEGKRNITLRLKQGVDDSNFIIYTDLNRLQQILTNLIGNALKFTEKGTIEFGYTLKNNNIEFYVKDTGLGIPPELHQKIFERFVKYDQTQTNGFSRGTGLGLAIASHLVDLLGGKIWLESQPGKGSTFYFTLPFQKTIQSYNSTTPEIVLPPLWNNKRILIAEDEDSNFILLKEILKPTKITIERAKNGREAVSICRQQPPYDLVLMDIKMPEMDGLEATKLLKKLHPSVPVIAQTAYAMQEEKDKALAAGCSNVITKPILKKQLFEILAVYLGY